MISLLAFLISLLIGIIIIKYFKYLNVPKHYNYFKIILTHTISFGESHEKTIYKVQIDRSVNGGKPKKYYVSQGFESKKDAENYGDDLVKSFKK